MNENRSANDEGAEILSYYGLSTFAYVPREEITEKGLEVCVEEAKTEPIKRLENAKARCPTTGIFEGRFTKTRFTFLQHWIRHCLILEVWAKWERVPNDRQRA